MIHFVSKAIPIHFINGNNIGLIHNSVVFGINSAHNAGLIIIIVLGCTLTITIFLPTLLTLVIPNTYYSQPYYYIY